MASATQDGGSASVPEPTAAAMRARVAAGVRSGSWTQARPRAVHARPQSPNGVEKSAYATGRRLREDRERGRMAALSRGFGGSPTIVTALPRRAGRAWGAPDLQEVA